MTGQKGLSAKLLRRGVSIKVIFWVDFRNYCLVGGSCILNRLNKLLDVTKYVANNPTLEELTRFLCINNCPSGELSSVYVARILDRKSLLVEAAHGYQEDGFIQVGKLFDIEMERPSGRAILKNQILFDPIDDSYFEKYPADAGKVTYQWSSKVSMPINENYFTQVSRYYPFEEHDELYYQTLQSLLQIYFSKIGKVSHEAGDLYGKELTQRQQDIYELVKKGLTNDEIALQIGFSSSLVKQETMLVFSKLGVSGRKGLTDLS
jgi:DNA-binding CsgD family transcriptional regulator